MHKILIYNTIFNKKKKIYFFCDFFYKKPISSMQCQLVIFKNIKFKPQNYDCITENQIFGR